MNKRYIQPTARVVRTAPLCIIATSPTTVTSIQSNDENETVDNLTIESTGTTTVSATEDVW